jgi:hypothetical protein
MKTAAYTTHQFINLTILKHDMERTKIGFAREKENSDTKVINNTTPSFDQRCGDGSDVDRTIISVVRGYMEQRSNKCYKEGADQELLSKMEKIFIRFYEDIV